MTITPIVALQSLTYFRCLTIGIPDETIHQGDTCMEISHHEKISFACMDCYDRLRDEIEFGDNE